MLPILMQNRSNDPPVRHISEYPRFTSPPLVCGKGKSIIYSDDWTGQIVACNEAINHTRRGIMTRYDPDNRFTMFPSGIPNGCHVIVRNEVANLHPWDITWTFGWEDIGLMDAIPTSMSAIMISAYLWDGPITVCGLDMLTNGSAEYAIVNQAVDSMQHLRLRDQLGRYSEIPVDVLERTFSYDGRCLAKIIEERKRDL